MKTRIQIALWVIVLGAFIAPSTFAEETTSEKVESEARHAKTAVKKEVRKLKKGVRDATGNSSTLEDAKDTMRNAGDSASDQFKDVKNKVDK